MMMLKDGRTLQVVGEVKVRIRIDPAPERMGKVVFKLI